MVLTTHSAVPENTFVFDDGYFGFSLYSNYISSLEGRAPTGYGYDLRLGFTTNQTYVCEFDRTSDKSATFNLYDGGDRLLGTYTTGNLGGAITPPANLPEQLHIALYAQDATAKFTFVEGVPEPGGLVLAASALLVVWARRRNRAP